MDFWITLVIVLITYIGIAIGRWPLLKANRTTITLMGVGMLLLFGQVRLEQIPGFLDIDTLILLFAMMVINANLQMAGFFDWAASAILRFTHSPGSFLALEIVLAGLLSALFLNDTICLMFTPLILGTAMALRRNPIPYLIALATSANIGSAATLTGNPQNMIIGAASKIPYLDFLLALGPPALLGLGVVWVVIVLFYPLEFRRNPFVKDGSQPVVIDRRLMTKCLIVIAGMLAAFLCGAPVAAAAFIAASLLLFTRRVQPEHVLKEINWGLLAFFAALFIVTGSLEANGIAQRLFESARLGSGTSLWTFSGATLVLSNLVSNVPAVLLLRPVIPSLASPLAGWLALAVVSTLAGNLTLLGSVANLIVAEIASKYRVDLSFSAYLRCGLVITLLTTVLAILWLQAIIW